MHGGLTSLLAENETYRQAGHRTCEFSQFSAFAIFSGTGLSRLIRRWQTASAVPSFQRLWPSLWGRLVSEALAFA